jgi:hypothetical protein
VRRRCDTADLEYKAEFHEAIESIIPSLIKWLGHQNEDFRLKGIELIGKLANHGEWQLNGSGTQLTRATKPSCINLLLACFHC